MSRARTSLKQWGSESTSNAGGAGSGFGDTHRLLSIDPPRPRSEPASGGAEAVSVLESGFLSRLDPDSSPVPDSGHDRAQRIIREAWAANSPQQAAKLAKRALEAYPDCAEAYILLAQYDSVYPGEIAERYRQAVAAAERALGPDVFKRCAGHFWEVVETRPYMRALLGLAKSIWHFGQREQAIAYYELMIRLNPEDNQGIRYLLMACLLQLRRDEQAEVLYQQYRNDRMASWAYSRAWLDFRKSGDSEVSRASLKKAVRTNALVPAYLTGRKKLPNDLPGLYGIGNANEAIIYTRDYMAIWKDCPGALQWLAARTSSKRPTPTRTAWAEQQIPEAQLGRPF